MNGAAFRGLVRGIVLSLLLGIALAGLVGMVEAMLVVITWQQYTPFYWAVAFLLGTSLGAVYAIVVWWNVRLQIRRDPSLSKRDWAPLMPRQVSLQALFTVMTLAALALGFVGWLGGHGLVLVLDFLVLTWGWANWQKRTRLFGIAVPKMTLGEFTVCVIICVVLHALFIPARSYSSSRPRPAPAGTQTPPRASSSERNSQRWLPFSVTWAIPTRR